MKKAVLLLLLLISLPVSSQNSKPFVVPELREWEGSIGSFTFTNKTKLLAAAGEAQNAADQFAADYREMIGTELKVSSGQVAEGDVHFTIDPEILKEKGSEAYRIEICKSVQVSANSSIGLYWATRTLLQMAAQPASLPAGLMVDYPDSPVR